MVVRKRVSKKGKDVVASSEASQPSSGERLDREVSPHDNTEPQLPGATSSRQHTSTLSTSSSVSSPPPSPRPADEESSTLFRGVGEAWAQPVNELWQCLALDQDAVRHYNTVMGQRSPHCAICSLFNRWKEAHGFQAVSSTDIPHRSLPMVPEVSFAISATNRRPFCDYNPVDEDGLSSLLTCSQCAVTVHASCYGVLKSEDISSWLCTACEASDSWNKQNCVLCCLRGGALKPTTDGRWAHIVCALTIAEAVFKKVRARSPINVSKITVERYKLRCGLCGPSLHENFQLQTACVQCSQGRCTRSFHVTCAYAAGVKFEVSDWPVPIYISCSKHLSPPQHRGEHRQQEELKELKEGEVVLAKHHRNKRYYKALVVHVHTSRLYEVDFDDGSFSEDLLPEDIESRDCAREGPPQKGQHVMIQWTDGDLYGATFRKVNIQDVYTVEFEDGAQLQAKREELWAESEDIPKYVRIRMSEATDSKYEIEVDPSGTEGRRPKRKLNYKTLGQQGGLV